MNARFYSLKTRTAGALAGILIGGLSLNVSAQAATLDERAPMRATLMPEMKVTALASDPTRSPRWSVANTRPSAVTLMPTMTVTPDLDSIALSVFPNIITIAGIQPLSTEALPTLSATSRQDRPLFLLAD